MIPAPADMELHAWMCEQGEVELESLGQGAGTMQGYIFIDGSCNTPADTRMRCAGWSAVEVSPYLINRKLVKLSAVFGERSQQPGRRHRKQASMPLR